MSLAEAHLGAILTMAHGSRARGRRRRHGTLPGTKLGGFGTRSVRPIQFFSRPAATLPLEPEGRLMLAAIPPVLRPLTQASDTRSRLRPRSARLVLATSGLVTRNMPERSAEDSHATPRPLQHPTTGALRRLRSGLRPAGGALVP